MYLVVSTVCDIFFNCIFDSLPSIVGVTSKFKELSFNNLFEVGSTIISFIFVSFDIKTDCISLLVVNDVVVNDISGLIILFIGDNKSLFIKTDSDSRGYVNGIEFNCVSGFIIFPVSEPLSSI